MANPHDLKRCVLAPLQDRQSFMDIVALFFFFFMAGSTQEFHMEMDGHQDM